jgi:hypothetical protein
MIDRGKLVQKNILATSLWIKIAEEVWVEIDITMVGFQNWVCRCMPYSTTKLMSALKYNELNVFTQNKSVQEQDLHSTNTGLVVTISLAGIPSF